MATPPRSRTFTMAHPARRRLVFAGTPEFAATSLRRLIEAGYPPITVYTQPDRPAGRGRRLHAGPVKVLALDAGIPVRQPQRLSSEQAQTELAALEPELMIVVAYGLLLPAAILTTPRLGCVNVHASLLPRWRGAAPIQRALLAGDRETGISLMRMDTGLDTGPVLARACCPITPDMTGGELHDQLAELGAALLVDRLPDLLSGNPVAQPQDDELACYATKLDKAEAEIDWRRPAAELARKINAFNPWPVAWTRLGDERLRLWRARAIEHSTTAAPGTVLSESATGVSVATGAGQLQLLALQLPGRPQRAVGDFIRGHSLLGHTLGRP